MNPRTTRRRLRLYRGAAWAVPLLAVGGALLLARSEPGWEPPRQSLAPVAFKPQRDGEVLDVDALAVIWQRELRQPLIDAPPPPPQEQPPEPPPAIRLVGTAVEAHVQYGIFQLGNNSAVVRPVGAEVDGFEIVSIERGRVRLRNGAREIDLTVPWYERIRAAQVTDEP